MTTKLEKSRALQCFGRLVEDVEQDPDPNTQDDLMEEFNCKNCDSYDYCRKLADTLDEAIEILTIHNDHNPNFTDADRREAHQLGIEALKWIANWRGVNSSLANIELPGETEE